MVTDDGNGTANHAAPERPDWLPQHLFPFEDRYVYIEGHRVHYVDEGEGPTILMCHGNPTYSFLYRHLIEALSDRFRCVAMDYPGFGLSQEAPGYDYKPASHAAVLDHFIKTLDLQEFTPFVQDWGGPIGLTAAVRNRERVRSLIIGNTWAWPKDDDPKARKFSAALGGKVGTRIIREGNIFVEMLLPLGMAKTKLSDAAMDAYRGPFLDPESREPTAVFPREIIGSTDFLQELSDALPTLADVPTLFVFGDKDPAFGVRDLLEWNQRLPKHRARRLKGAGHFIQEDAPGEIAQHVRSWWDEMVVPAGASR